MCMAHKERASASDISRRKLMAGAGMAGASALAGCFGDDDGDVEALPDELTLLHFETDDDRRQVIGELGDSFEAETGVGFSQRVTQEGDLPTEITAAVAADNLPNVASLPLSVSLLGRDSIDEESATEVVEEIGEDRFYDNLIDLVRVPGEEDQFFGVPLYTWPQLTIYRQELFDELGLPEPRTWDNLLECAEALHDPDDNQFGIYLGTDNDQYATQCFTGFALSNNARVFNEDGDIVFDSDEMVEALEVYQQLAEFTQDGALDAGGIGPAYDNENVHLYSGNAFSLFFNSLGLEEGEMMPEGVVDSIEHERSATYGELVLMTTMTGQNPGEIDASQQFKEHIIGDTDNYIDWCHMQVGGFQPVMEEITEMDEYRDHPILESWSDELKDDVLPNAVQRSERFGFVGGNSFPEIGQITGNFIVATAVRDVALEGENPQTVAEDAAEEMRNRIS